MSKNIHEPLPTSFDLQSIPEGFVLVPLDHLPDVALAPLLATFRRISQTRDRINSMLIAAGFPATSAADQDVRVANEAAVRLSDEIAFRQTSEKELIGKTILSILESKDNNVADVGEGNDDNTNNDNTND